MKVARQTSIGQTSRFRVEAKEIQALKEAKERKKGKALGDRDG